MKNRKTLILICGLLFFVIIGGLYGLTKMNHNMGTHSQTHASGSEVQSNKEEGTDQANNEDSSLGKVNAEADEVLKNIEFVQYVVNEKDTLWRIAKTYMPLYNAYPEDGKAGVIDYIVKENKLEKSADGRFVIYVGQKLTIPKQKDIALVNTKTVITTENKTEDIQTNTEAKKPAESNEENVQDNHTDHTNHN